MEINSLTGAHGLLFAEPAVPEAVLTNADSNHPWYRREPYDPFDNSSEAVTAHQEGEHLPVVQHNLTDIQRTWELGEVIREFVAGKDITTKKL